MEPYYDTNKLSHEKMECLELPTEENQIDSNCGHPEEISVEDIDEVQNEELLQETNKKSEGKKENEKQEDEYNDFEHSNELNQIKEEKNNDNDNQDIEQYCHQPEEDQQQQENVNQIYDEQNNPDDANPKEEQKLNKNINLPKGQNNDKNYSFKQVIPNIPQNPQPINQGVSNTSSTKSLDKIPIENIPFMYSSLLEKYRQVVKDKDQAVKALNEEIIANEHQKSQINVLKKSLNDIVRKQHQPGRGNNSQINLKEDVGEIFLEIPRLKSEVENYKSQVLLLEKKLKKLQKEKDDAQNLSQSVTQSLAEAKGSIDKLNEVVGQYEKESNEANEIIKNLSEQNLQLKQDVELGQQKERKYKQEIAYKDQLERNLNDLKEKKEELVKIVEQKGKEIAEYKSGVNETKNEHKNLLEQIATKDNQLKELYQSNRELTEIVGQYQAVIEKLKAEKGFYQKSKEEFSTTITTKENILNELKENNMKLQIENENLLKENTNLSKELSNFKNELALANEAVEENKKEIEKQNLELKSKEEETKKLSDDLLILQTKSSHNEEIYQDQIKKMQGDIVTLKKENDDLMKKFHGEMVEKEKKIATLENEIENPQSNPNFRMYHPRMAIQSCLTASKMLMDNAHKFYSEQNFQTFLDSVDYLRRELEVCYRALSKEDANEFFLRNLTDKYEKACKDINSYRNDNKKLFDYNIEISDENEFLKNISEFQNELMQRMLQYYLLDYDIKAIIGGIWENGIKYIYRVKDLKLTTKKIKKINLFIKNINNNSSTKLDFIELQKLENEKNFIEEQIDNISRIKGEYDYKLQIYDKKALAKSPQFYEENKQN